MPVGVFSRAFISQLGNYFKIPVLLDGLRGSVVLRGLVENGGVIFFEILVAVFRVGGSRFLRNNSAYLQNFKHVTSQGQNPYSNHR